MSAPPPFIRRYAILALASLGAAPSAYACADEWEWIDVDLEHISTVQTFQDANGTVWDVETQVLTGTSNEWAGPVEIIVCSDLLDPGSTMSDTCAQAGLLDTGVWNAIWTNDFANATGPVSGGPTLFPRGEFEGFIDAGELVAKRVQRAKPRCGREIRLTPYDDIIPDNLGTGLTTYDGSLEDSNTFVWSSTSGTLPGCFDNATPPTDVCPADVLSVATTGDRTSDHTWYALNVGHTLPTEPFETDFDYSIEDYDRPVGPLLPSRVAYGRIQWDWIWHGTCSDDPDQWCLPDDHERVDADPDIIAASACGGGTGTCQMACPGGPAPDDTELKYDFDLLLDFVERAYDGDAVPTFEDGTTPDAMRISQRAALRIMPWSNYRWADADADWARSLSVPSFLPDACGAQVKRSGVIGSDSATIDRPYAYVEARDPVYREQVHRLVDALTGNTSYVDLSTTHADYFTTYSGVDGDPRVFSVDVGSAGAFGEWNLNAPDAFRPVDTDAGNYLSRRKAFFANTPDTAGLHDADTGAYSNLPPGDTGLWTPDCEQVNTGSPNLYAIRPNTWWADLHDAYLDRFSGLVRGFPQTHLLGKASYTRSTVFPPDDWLPSPSDNQGYCYRPEEYAVGRRSVAGTGTGNPDDPDLYDYVNAPTNNLSQLEEAYEADSRMGVRFDSWGVANIRNDYPGADRTRYALAGDAWKRSSFQAEVANTIPGLVASNRSLYGPSGTPYGIWDLDETVRYSVAGRYSLFNLKNAPIPQEESDYYLTAGVPFPEENQQLAANFCECHDDWDGDDTTFGPCVVTEIATLLRDTGFRIHPTTRAYRSEVEEGTSLRTLTRFRHVGNVPPLSAYQLEFAFVDRDDFDGPPVSTNHRKVLQYPHVAFAPPSAATALDTLFVDHITIPYTGTNGFQPRAELLPREEDTPLGTWDPERQVSYATAGTCQTQANDEALLGEDGATATPADYGTDAPRATYHEIEVDLPVPCVDADEDYMILFRLRDASLDALSGLTGAPAAKAVPMDLLSPRRVGDADNPRWYFYGYLDILETTACNSDTGI